MLRSLVRFQLAPPVRLPGDRSPLGPRSSKPPPPHPRLPAGEHEGVGAGSPPGRPSSVLAPLLGSRTPDATRRTVVSYPHDDVGSSSSCGAMRGRHRRRRHAGDMGRRPSTEHPVCLASGGGADHRGWRSILPELCASETERTLWSPQGGSLAEECRVAVFDQRGTGASLHETPASSAKRMGSDIVTVIRAVLGEPCTVVGHSMGGMAALHAVLDCPSSFSALVLVATTAGGSGLTSPSDTYLSLAATDPDLTDRSRVRRDLEFAVSPAFRLERPDLFEACVVYATTQPRAVDSDALAQVFMTHDVADRLRDHAPDRRDLRHRGSDTPVAEFVVPGGPHPLVPLRGR